MSFNKLTPAEVERLALLSEECGEAVQAIGKILRHGYNSNYGNGDTNREALHREIGDILGVIEMMTEAGDLDGKTLTFYQTDKLRRVQPYLHHQKKTP